MDEETREQLRRVMGVSGLQSSDGRAVSRLVISPKQFGDFLLAPPSEVPVGPVSGVADAIERSLTEAGFTITSRTIPGAPAPYQLTGRPARDGMVIGDRKVTPDTAYNRTTRSVVVGLLFAWLALVGIAVAGFRGFWIQSVFIGALLLAIPAFVIGIFRGLGFTSEVAGARLESLVEVGTRSDGELPSLPLRVTLGVAYVRSHASMQGGMAARQVVTIEKLPALASVLGSMDAHWRQLPPSHVPKEERLLP
ncbi:MAG: hypothetical protein L3K17_01630 [Thermoplasmata archaeon]|nr:hypothetical protein [Thermoplasmata archaeon]